MTEYLKNLIFEAEIEGMNMTEGQSKEALRVMLQAVEDTKDKFGPPTEENERQAALHIIEKWIEWAESKGYSDAEVLVLHTMVKHEFIAFSKAFRLG